MSMSYIRRTYGVPAKRGAVVMYQRHPCQPAVKGRITGARNAHIRVRLDGEKYSVPFHPTDEAITYVEGQA